MSKDILRISDRQTQYSLRRYKCMPIIGDNGELLEGLLEVKIEKPFLLLDTVIIDEIDTHDRDSNLSQGVDNSLQYISQHPIINILQVANCTAFHNSPNLYNVEDLRKNDTDSQYLFVLICTNF